MSDPFREAMVEAVRDKIDPEAVQAEIRTAVRALVSNRRLVSIKTAASLCDVAIV